MLCIVTSISRSLWSLSCAASFVSSQPAISQSYVRLTHARVIFQTFIIKILIFDTHNLASIYLLQNYIIVKLSFTEAIYIAYVHGLTIVLKNSDYLVWI